MELFMREISGITIVFLIGLGYALLELFVAKGRGTHTILWSIISLLFAGEFFWGLNLFSDLFSLVAFGSSFYAGYRICEGYWEWYVQHLIEEGSVILAFGLLRRMGTPEEKIRVLEKEHFPPVRK